MATTVLDYTTWRAGRVVERGTYQGRAWTRKIVRCAKCGRRGMERPSHDTAGKHYPAEVYHVVEQTTYPFSMLLVKDYCIIPDESGKY